MFFKLFCFGKGNFFSGLQTTKKPQSSHEEKDGKVPQKLINENYSSLLKQVSKEKDILFHGISLSIGSKGPLNYKLIEQFDTSGQVEYIVLNENDNYAFLADLTIGLLVLDIKDIFNI